MGVQVVWFKLDLRIFDHEALYRAAAKGPILPLYVFEPDLWKQPDTSGRHFSFLVECLQDLNNQLTALNGPMIFRTGSMEDVLEKLDNQYEIDALWSHQETWNDWTYQRDIRVKRWCKSRGIPWHEPLQYGVRRPLKTREGWARQWDIQMSSAPYPRPERIAPLEINTGCIPVPEDLDILPDPCELRQKGGRSEAVRTLDTFLNHRGETYQKAMSSPVTAFDACSRLSPYLAFGVLSLREVYQAAEARKKELRSGQDPSRATWLKSLHAFTGRLHWHCHFMQKLEDEPDIEFESFHPMLRTVREEHEHHDAYLAAWTRGKTGYPMVDACMRALNETGWLNFRMRAMLMSFASYHLWLPWRQPALHLARKFLDYEPGIHYSQCQMQSGLTGINAIRIYNPIKQGLDHDPDAEFIKQWVPELRLVSPARIHDGRDLHVFCPEYPPPVVQEKAARKKAADCMFAVRESPDFQAIALQIREKHGSRKSGLRASQMQNVRPERTSRSAQSPVKSKKNPNQMELGF